MKIKHQYFKFHPMHQKSTICLLKALIFISVLFLSSLRLSAQSRRSPIYDSIHPFMQTYIGLNSPFKKTSNFYGVQIGFRCYLPRTPIYLGVENIYCYGNNQYNWPDVGKYSYIRTTNCLSPIIGIRAYNQYKVSAGYAIRFNYVTYDAQLKTNNPLLKEYLWNHYSGEHFSLGFSKYVAFRFNKHITSYVDINFFRMYKEQFNLLFGFGITYQIIGRSSKNKVKKEWKIEM